MFFGWRTRWHSDGLNDVSGGMNYTLKQVEETALYTRVIVDIGEPPGNVVWDRSQDVSLWW